MNSNSSLLFIVVLSTIFTTAEFQKDPGFDQPCYGNNEQYPDEEMLQPPEQSGNECPPSEVDYPGNYPWYGMPWLFPPWYLAICCTPPTKKQETEKPKTTEPSTHLAENHSSENPSSENPKPENHLSEKPPPENPKSENPPPENPPPENPPPENPPPENPPTESVPPELPTTEPPSPPEEEVCPPRATPQELPPDVAPRHCGEVVLPENAVIDGVFEILIGETNSNVVCRSDPENGPAWTIIQRRMDGSVDFNQNWEQYENGFGEATGEYWLGLKKIYEMTSSANYELWIELTGFKDETMRAKYGLFFLGDAAQKYKLNVCKYSGDAGDALTYHNGNKFSTHDSDNDSSKDNCAETYKSGWWMADCQTSNLNGDYRRHPGFEESGVKWDSISEDTGFKYAHMAIRPQPSE